MVGTGGFTKEIFPPLETLAHKIQVATAPHPTGGAAS